MQGSTNPSCIYMKLTYSKFLETLCKKTCLFCYTLKLYSEGQDPLDLWRCFSYGMAADLRVIQHADHFPDLRCILLIIEHLAMMKNTWSGPCKCKQLITRGNLFMICLHVLFHEKKKKTLLYIYLDGVWTDLISEKYLTHFFNNTSVVHS
jgi:hypothetical protein